MSSSSSWKSYGGTNHLEIANDITVNDLTVDTLSLKTHTWSQSHRDIYTTGNVNISSNPTPPETQTPLETPPSPAPDRRLIRTR
jgi:hypothetical protein